VTEHQWGRIEGVRIVRTPRPVVRRFLSGFALGAVGLYAVCALAAVWWPLAVVGLVIVVRGFKAYSHS
jgi:hypothetical protein